jgi:hypothetical protein
VIVSSVRERNESAWLLPNDGTRTNCRLCTNDGTRTNHQLRPDSHGMRRFEDWGKS